MKWQAKSKSTNPTHDLFGAMDGDSMEQMMKELEGMMDSGDFEDMFGGLMNSLASKDLLYEPMKDLANKVWLQSTGWSIEDSILISFNVYSILNGSKKTRQLYLQMNWVAIKHSIE